MRLTTRGRQVVDHLVPEPAGFVLGGVASRSKVLATRLSARRVLFAFPKVDGAMVVDVKGSSSRVSSRLSVVDRHVRSTTLSRHTVSRRSRKSAT
jgi:hypothetical protein